MKKRFCISAVSNVLIVGILVMLSAFCVKGSVRQTFRPYYHGETESSRVGLMFNVYQGSEYVEQILDILDRNRAVATFFVGGVWAEKNTELLKKMALSSEIGNHGYLHRDHKNISSKQNEEELTLCHALVKKVTGLEMTLFAPPSGSYGDDTLSQCENHGYTVVLWSKDTIDWRDHDADVIYRRATTDVRGGDLILMHPTAQTVEALPAILKTLGEKNLLPSTVTDVLNGAAVI